MTAHQELKREKEIDGLRNLLLQCWAVQKKSSPNEIKQSSSSELIWTKNVEICSLEGTTVKKSHNLPIYFKKGTASVASVSEFVSQEAFDGNAVVLLDAENLKIPDTIGTRGIYIILQISR